MTHAIKALTSITRLRYCFAVAIAVASVMIACNGKLKCEYFIVIKQ